MKRERVDAVMRWPFWVAALLLFCSPVLAIPPAAVSHYEEGQKLFGAQDYAGALEHFQKAKEFAKDEPLIESWIGACYNAMGNYTEAETHLNAAIATLQKKRRAVDIGYYALLGRIQANLHRFDTAVATVESFTFKDDGSAKAAKAKEDFAKAKVALRDTIVSVGGDCVRAKDRACVRAAFAQADILAPQETTTLEAFAREAAHLAARAPAGTDEEKAARLVLYDTALEATRIWIEAAPPEKAPEIKRQLATVLLGTKRPEDVEEARQILVALWDASPEPKDVSLQLDLASVYLGLEQWDQAVTCAKTYIEQAPPDKKGAGYCRLALAYRNQVKCPEALAAGKLCTNADGTPADLPYLRVCENKLAEEALRAEKEAARRAEILKNDCQNLSNLASWAHDNALDITIPEYVDAVKSVATKAGQCGPTGVKIMDLQTLCLVGVGLMSNPVNLSVLAAEGQLDSYLPAYETYLKQCGRLLAPNQKANVENALSRVKNSLGVPQ